MALQTNRLFKIVAGPALLFALLSLAAALIAFPFGITEFSRGIGATAFIIVPDALATLWLVRRLRVHLAARTSRRAAIAFAFSAPVVLAVGFALGELVGGYAEVFLGRVFILPAIILFLAVLMITIPVVVVRWALHPSGGVDPVNEGSQ